MKGKGNLTFFASLSLLSPLLGDLFVLDLDLDLKRMINIKWDKETHLNPVNLKYEIGRRKKEALTLTWISILISCCGSEILTLTLKSSFRFGFET